MFMKKILAAVFISGFIFAGCASDKTPSGVIRIVAKIAKESRSPEEYQQKIDKYTVGGISGLTWWSLSNLKASQSELYPHESIKKITEELTWYDGEYAETATVTVEFKESGPFKFKLAKERGQWKVKF